MKLNKRGQIDFDDLNVPGILFAIVGAFIGLIVAAKMGAGIFIKIATVLVTAIACYFVGGKISES